MLNIIYAIFFGLIEGITEWLPISSTGHLILFETFFKFENVSQGFFDMFEVVIQLGAIMAVIVIFFKKLLPFEKEDNKIKISKNKMAMWAKILISCIPAAIIGLKFDDVFNKYFYNNTSIAIMLILVGIIFIWVETKHKSKNRVKTMEELTYRDALIIGLFQLIAAIFPGTSRSGATIIGALLIGISRSVAAEYTFYLAIPVMFGASLLKVVKFGAISSNEMALLVVASLVAFVTSIFVIKFFINYVKKKDFKAFGVYRILLGIIVLILVGLKIM